MISRILIAVDAHQRDPTALEMAALLAARRESELVALFIEDQNLIHLANLPFASEVNRVSGARRRLDTPQMASILGSQVAQTRRALSRITERLRVRSSLKVTRGEYFSQAVTEASDTDVLFLVRSTRVVQRRRPVSSDRPPEARDNMLQDKSVAVVYDGSECAARALILAAELATQNEMRLIVELLPPAGEEIARLRDAIDEVLAERKDELRLDVRTVTDVAELFQAISDMPCELLVIPRDFAVHLGRGGRTAVDLGGCSIVLVP